MRTLTETTALVAVVAMCKVDSYTVMISEETARSIAGSMPLPMIGQRYAVFWGEEAGQIVDRLSLCSHAGGYYLVSHTYRTDRWPEIFRIEVKDKPHTGV